MPRGTISKAITAAGYVAVRLPALTSASAYSLWTEDGASWYYATVAAGTDGVLVTTGSSGFPVSITENLEKLTAGALVCYAKGTTSTNLVGIIVA